MAELARDGHHADQRGEECRRGAGREQRVLVVVCHELARLRYEAVEQHREQDERDHPREQTEVGARGAHLAQLCEQLVSHDGSSAVSSRKTSSRLDDSDTSSFSGMPAS